MSVLEQVAEQEAAEAAAKEERYIEVVRKLSNGTDDPSLETVTAALRETGRTSEDLTSDVQSFKHELAARAKLAAVAEAVAELPGIAEKIAAADAKLAAAQEAHQRELLPLIGRRNDISNMQLQATTLRTERARIQATEGGWKPRVPAAQRPQKVAASGGRKRDSYGWEKV